MEAKSGLVLVTEGILDMMDEVLEEVVSLIDLPDQVLETIFLQLAPKDIISAAITSQSFHSFCTSERLWYLLCQKRWGMKTDPKQWLVSKEHALPDNVDLQKHLPQDYR